MRAHDWSSTPLGPLETWPQSLRSTLSTCLNSQAVSAIYWGPEFRLLYNDAYRPFLDSRHPWALGRPMAEIWPTMWQALTASAGQVYETGHGIVAENQLLLMERDGGLVESFWFYSFAPIRGETGQVDGIFLTALDTTGRVLAERYNASERERLARMFEQAPGFMAMLDGPEHRFALVNPAYLQLVGHRDVLGRTVAEALPEVVEQGFIGLLDRVYRTGEPFIGQALPILLQREPAGPTEGRFVDFVYQPVSDAQGRVTGIFVEGADATERTRAETALADREQELRTLTDALPVLVSYIDAERRYRFNNKIYETWFPRKREEIVGKLVREVVGEAAYAKVAHHMDAALRGERVTFDQFMPYADTAGRHIEVEYIPRAAPDGSIEGFYTLVQDVTARKTAEEALRKSEAELRALNADLERQVVDRMRERAVTWEVSPDLMGALDPQGYFRTSNPAWFSLLGWTPEEVASQSIWELLHPDDLERTRGGFELTQIGQPAIRFPNRYRHKDGSYRWISWVGIPVDGMVYCTGRDITVEREQEAELARRTAERDRLWSTTQDLQVVIDGAGVFQDVNPAFTHVLGWTPQEVIGRTVFDFVLPKDDELTQAALEHAQQDTLPAVENRYRHKDGGFRWISWVAAPEGEFIYASGRHITEQKEQAAALAQAEEALRQSQKMEAVGQLTGGLAHDFNNLLAGISGSLELMDSRIAQGRHADVDRYMAAAQGAARRAAALTHRLLAFSRRQTLAPKVTEVNALVSGMEDLIRRTVGPQVSVESVTGAGVWPVEIDPNQLENALLNLAINARDAMPDGGRVTIETANRWMDARTAREQELSPGQYVSLSVSDTGTGMAPEVAARAFDPFFTTKPLGVGTGLGLSMVYGFARQSGGQVRIYSEVGQGTTVCLYLPRHLGRADEAEVDETQATAAPAVQAGQMVLVIDDEPVVRMLVVDVLEELGYAAQEASDGAEGLKVLQSKARVDLLITDVGLPGGLNGRQVADAARALRPELKVLFITGYAENAVLNNGHLEPGMQVVTKPFAVEDLARRIRDILSQS
ncbi:PAS domain S-box-containing protein [Rubellimicrobium aerolatum]|nr:PAS domain S-box-containing protein [Rubellimicrobium aerolatum]